jgi:hypothetical protein
MKRGALGRLRNKRDFGRRSEEPCVELISVYILEVQRYRVDAWLLLVHVAYPMRGQIDLAVLLVRQFRLATDLISVSRVWMPGFVPRLPLVESHIVLDEKKHLIRQI